MAFRYQAIDAGGQTRTDVLDAASAEEAANLLRDRGLFVTRLEDANPQDTQDARSAPQAKTKGARFRDVVLFTQQMSMLLRSGAQVVEALDAVVDQTSRPAWGRVVSSIRMDVQEGRPLSAALARFPHLFPGIFLSMITAGEASGELGVAFERLSDLTRQQQEVRNRVIGAISYPVVLMMLCGAVMIVMFTFVLPRFAEMFEVLGVNLPITTAVLIGMCRWSQSHWPYLLAGVAATVFGVVSFVRSPTGRETIALVALRIPVIGTLIRNIILARICRIWGQLLESKVTMLDAVELIARGTANREFHELIGKIAQAVTQGSRIGPELKASWLVPKTYAGAMSTGEDSGRLTDSLLFVASSLEDQNTQALGALTRILEPIILAVMGLVVGTLAFSLFVPMFDMATVTSE